MQLDSQCGMHHAATVTPRRRPVLVDYKTVSCTRL
jgi:hypothetical protein